MPDKNENLSVWNSILGQRVMIYEFMKTKMIHLLDNVMKNQNQTPFTVTSTEKLLIPYTDIEWNKLKLIKGFIGMTSIILLNGSTRCSVPCRDEMICKTGAMMSLVLCVLYLRA